jgi:hypothetical protein
MTQAAGNAFSREEWIAYYSRKRIVHQWTQVQLLSTVPSRRVLEIGPAMGLVTALLVNAGYEVETLGELPRGFAEPAVRHIRAKLEEVRPADIAGFDAILCCETLEHCAWADVGPVLATLRQSGAKYLVVSVPYMAFQLTFDLYLNRHMLRQHFCLRKLTGRRRFAPQPPGGHQWEIGYKGYPLRRWERLLKETGWSVRRRDFTEHCLSVFHLLEAA